MKSKEPGKWQGELTLGDVEHSTLLAANGARRMAVGKGSGGKREMGNGARMHGKRGKEPKREKGNGKRDKDTREKG